MTTAADKKGDLVDLFLDMKKQGLIGEPSHIAEYPETVIKTLKIFVDVFKLPNGAIPSRRSKGKYANWINGLQELEKICPVDMEECMRFALKRYEDMGKPFLIYQPQSIQKLLIDAVADLKRRREQEKEIREEKEVKFADAKDIKSKLGNFLED